MPVGGVRRLSVDGLADVGAHSAFDIFGVVVVARLDVAVGDDAVVVPVIARDSRRDGVIERDFLAVVGVGLRTQHSEDCLCGREVGVVTDPEILLVGYALAGASDVAEVTLHIRAVAIVAAELPELLETLRHEGVVVELGANAVLDVDCLLLLSERGDGDEHHEYDRRQRAEHDERRPSAPLSDQLALGVVGDLAEERQHEEGEEVVQSHDEAADGVGKAVCMLQKKGDDKVVRRPENHDYRKRETDFESLFVVKPKGFEFLPVAGPFARRRAERVFGNLFLLRLRG